MQFRDRTVGTPESCYGHWVSRKSGICLSPDPHPNCPRKKMMEDTKRAKKCLVDATRRIVLSASSQTKELYTSKIEEINQIKMYEVIERMFISDNSLISCNPTLRNIKISREVSKKLLYSFYKKYEKSQIESFHDSGLYKQLINKILFTRTYILVLINVEHTERSGVQTLEEEEVNDIIELHIKRKTEMEKEKDGVKNEVHTHLAERGTWNYIQEQVYQHLKRQGTCPRSLELRRAILKGLLPIQDGDSDDDDDDYEEIVYGKIPRVIDSDSDDDDHYIPIVHSRLVTCV